MLDFDRLRFPNSGVDCYLIRGISALNCGVSEVIPDDYLRSSVPSFKGELGILTGNF